MNEWKTSPLWPDLQRVAENERLTHLLSNAPQNFDSHWVWLPEDRDEKCLTMVRSAHA